jgi:hypothetical protein
VLELAPEPKLVALNEYGRMFAGVFLDGDRIYLRTYDDVICIGPKGKEGAEYVRQAPGRIRLAELAMVMAGETYPNRERTVKYIRQHYGNDLTPLTEIVDRIGTEAHFTNSLAILPDCLTQSNRDKLVAAVDARLPAASGVTRERLLRLLPPVGGDRALKILTGALAAGAAEQRIIAARALGHWQDEKPLPALNSVIRSKADSKLRTEALRSYIMLLAVSTRKIKERQADMAALLPVAESLQFVPDLFQATTHFPPADAVEFLGRYVRDARLGELAAAAMIETARRASGKQLADIIQTMDVHAIATKSAAARKKIKAAMAGFKEKVDAAPPASPGAADGDDSLDLPDLDL